MPITPSQSEINWRARCQARCVVSGFDSSTETRSTASGFDFAVGPLRPTPRGQYASLGGTVKTPGAATRYAYFKSQMSDRIICNLRYVICDSAQGADYSQRFMLEK